MHNLTPTERHNIGENLNDPDGYSSTDIYSRDRDDQALDLQFTDEL